MRENRSAHRGFTLIELLVVIAIIAILAAILFPAFGHVREKTRQSTCMQQMGAIAQAIKLYKEDNGKFPTVMCANPYFTNAGGQQQLYIGTGTPLEIDQVLARPLIKQKTTATGKQAFLCPDNVNPNPTAVTTAVYPANVPLSGQVMNAGKPAYFYTYDSYDIGPALDSSFNAMPPYTYEVHYALDWTGMTGANDPQNQLKYPNPPESNTVVTWCTYHCGVAHAGIIPVLMLSGTVKPIPANQFTTKGPLKFNF